MLTSSTRLLKHLVIKFIKSGWTVPFSPFSPTELPVGNDGLKGSLDSKFHDRGSYNSMLCTNQPATGLKTPFPSLTSVIAKIRMP